MQKLDEQKKMFIARSCQENLVETVKWDLSRARSHSLTHISLASFLWDIGNCADPDQTPHNAVSSQDLHALLTEFSIRIGIKMKNTTHQPLKRK